MESYLVKPGSKVDLSKHDPNEHGFCANKKQGEKVLRTLVGRIRDQQWVLYAEHKHRVLVVLQAMDTGGKDGTIRSIFRYIDPLGIRIANFKTPTEPELDHDYLWRIHKQVPGRGEIVVFNRSHYEDVLVVRVHNLVPKTIWKRRYDQINDFERMLAEEGTTILKFFLHISPEEQLSRLKARLKNPDKNWKFSKQDLEERKLWPEYTKAYEAVLSRTSTEWAPWYVVPADRKWYRNVVVASILAEVLESLKMEFPKPEEDLSKIVLE